MNEEDIVDTLRSVCDPQYEQLCKNAADEIETLRIQRSSVINVLDNLIVDMLKMRGTIRRYDE